MSQTTNESDDEIMSKDRTDSFLEDDGNLGCGSGGVGLKKGPWTSAEDAILIDYVKKYGEGNWNSAQKHSGLFRCGKSCRLRWANHLRPNLKKGAFTSAEEQLIIELHSKMGNKWARMASYLPGRTDNEIKNYWNTRIKRRQRAGLPLYPPELFLQALQEGGHNNQSPVQEEWCGLLQSNPRVHNLEASQVASPYLLGGGIISESKPTSHCHTSFNASEKISEPFEPGSRGWFSYIISNNFSTSNPAISGDVKLELPSFQYTAETDLGSWVTTPRTPTIPESVDSSIPPGWPRNSGLLDALLHEAKTLRCGNNHSSEKGSNSSSDVVDSHNRKACETELEDYGDSISSSLDKYPSFEFIGCENLTGWDVEREAVDDDLWLKDEDGE